MESPGILAEFNGGWGLTSTLLDEVTVVDEYTVAVKLTTPYYGALQDFAVPMPMSMMSPAAGEMTLEELFSRSSREFSEELSQYLPRRGRGDAGHVYKHHSGQDVYLGHDV